MPVSVPRDRIKDLPLEVVRAAIQGDTAARKRVLETYYDFVRRMLFRLLGPHPEVDDLTQVVMERMMANLSGLKAEDRLTAWVCSICTSVATDALRAKKKRHVPLPDYEFEAEGVDTQAIADARGILKHCMTVLDALSPNHRTVFVLRVIEGYSIDEIAEMTKSARSTTRLRLYFARKAFGRAVAKFGLRVPVPSKEEP